MNTPLKEVDVVKNPATTGRSALLFIEIRPNMNGKPIKKRGFFRIQNEKRFI